MIILGKEQHLGHPAFLLMMFRNAIPCILVLLIALGLSIFSGVIQEGINESMIMGGPLQFLSPEQASAYLAFIIEGFYVLTFLLFLVAYIITKLVYTNYTFTFEEFDLRLKRGIFNLVTISIPFRQIQNVNIHRSLAYRILGVSRVVIDSAGHEEGQVDTKSHITLEPIDESIAEDIRLFLQRKIGVQVVEGEHEADQEMKAANAINS